MTNTTTHGQVPEALRLAEQYDHGDPAAHGNAWKAAVCTELRRQHARIAELEAQLEAVGAGGVQALSAAPADVEDAIAWLVTWKGGEHTYVHAHASELPAVTQARVMGGTVTPCVAALAASPTPPAEQQAAPKAAPSGPDYSEKWDAELGRTAMRFVDRAGDVHPGIDGAETICDEFHKAMSEVIGRMPHVQRMAAPQQEAQEPVATLHCNDIGYVWARATEVGTRMRFEQPINLYTAPQPAPAPLSDDAKDAARWRMAALIGNEVMLHPDKRTHATAVKAYMDATHSGSDLTGAVDAAIAAQGGK